MPVYKTDGMRTYEVWNYNGQDNSKAYDGSANILLDNTEYGIENVVSYYRTELQAMAATISALSSDWQNVVFLTDTHGSANKQHSQAMAIWLAENAPIDFIHLNGDFSNDPWSTSEYLTFVQPFVMRKIAKRTYAAYGNHETYGSQAAESKPNICRDFVYPHSVIGNFDNLYYYFDNAEKKTRWMVINTSDTSAYTIGQTQLEWIRQNVQLPDTDWHLVVFGHVNLNDLGGITTQNEANAAAVISAIASCNGSIVGYVCGHQHIDDTRNIGDFQQTTLMCDRFENTDYYNGLSYTERVAGTDNEQAITIMSLNTQTREVVFRRIGAGWASIVEGLHYTY